MLPSILSLLVAVLAFLLTGRTRGPAGGPPKQRLTALLVGAALATLLAVALNRSSHALVEGTLAILLVAVLWGSVALVVSLAIERASRGGLITAVIFAAIAVVLLLADASRLPVALTLLPATFRTPWLRRTTPFLARVTALAAALAFLLRGLDPFDALPAFPHVQALLIEGGVAVIQSYALVIAVKLLITFPGHLFDYLRLRERLVVSYALIAGIPALLAFVLLAIVSFFVMGSYRASLVERLLAPPPDAIEAAERLLADDALLEALTRAPGARQAALEASLPTSGSWQAPAAGEPAPFVLAAVHDSTAGTSSVAAAPVAGAPAAAASLAALAPPCPYDGLLFAGDQLYATRGVSREIDTAEFVVQVFHPLGQRDLARISAMAGVEIHVLFTDSLTIEEGADGEDLSISIEDDPNVIHRSSLPADELDETAIGNLYDRSDLLLGARQVATYRLTGGESLHRSGGLIIVRRGGPELVAAIREAMEQPVNRIIAVALALVASLFLIVMLAALLTGGTIARGITHSVGKLTHATRMLSQDRLNHRIKIERGDELGELGVAFNNMAKGLEERRRLVIEQERLHSELSVAYEIQQRLLPAGTPAFADLDLAGISVPSREVGGDAYDFVSWGKEQLAVTISDVAGKGVPAALLMSNLQAAVRAHAQRPGELDRVVSELNDLVCASTSPGRFITFFIGVVDAGGDRLTYVNAGHNPPFLVHVDGEFETLDKGGVLIGALPNQSYEMGQANLGPGDLLVLYTDGVIEAQSVEEEFFEEVRLEELLRQTSPNETAAQVRDRIVEAVERFGVGTEQSDDVTVVVIQRKARLMIGSRGAGVEPGRG